MAKFRHSQTNFTGGEVSPQAWGRTDLPQYQNAVKSLRNMIPMTAGGAYRRPGTVFDHGFSESATSSPRLLPFIFSQSEAYLIEMYTTFGGPTKVLAAWRADSTSNFAPSNSATVTGTHPYEVSGFTSGSGYTAGAYDEADEVQYAQSADIMWMVHPNHKPKTLSRTSLDHFTMQDFDGGLTGVALRDAWPYLAQNTTATTIAPSATSGAGITLTASAATFNAKHVGAIFKIIGGGTVGAAQVTAFTDSTHVTATVIVNFNSTAALTTWWESAWSDYRGWPQAVCFYQQRIVFGGTPSFPDSMWFSHAFNYFVLSISDDITPTSPTTGSSAYQGNNPFQVIPASNQLNVIQWLSSERTLVIGTSADEFVMTFTPNGTDSGFAVDTYLCQVQTHYGSSHHLPVRAGNELFFCSRPDDELRALTFDYLQQQYTANPIQNLFRSYPAFEPSRGTRKFRTFAWDKSRRTMWCLDTAGNLFTLTRDKELNVAAWASHQMGGYDASHSGSGKSAALQTATLVAGSVTSLTAVPNPITGVDDIWMTVKRYVNGAFQFHVERLVGRDLLSATDLLMYLSWDAGDFFTDSSVWVFNAATASISPEDYNLHYLSASPDLLAHLIGASIVGTAMTENGIFYMPPMTVIDPGVGFTPMTQPYPPNWATAVNPDAVVGYNFTSYVETLRIEAGSQIGSAQGEVKRIDEIYVRFYRTLQAKVGVSTKQAPDPSTYESLQFRDGSTPMQDSSELATRDFTIKPQSDYDREGIIVVLQDLPLPFAVTSISQRGLGSEG